MQGQFVVASAIAVVVTAALLPGSGLGSSAPAVRSPHGIPAGLADAIRARLAGAGSGCRCEGPDLGASVALSADGTTALVGAPNANHYKGAAFVFHVSDAGSWSSSHTPTATLAISPGRANEAFGSSTALSADGTTAFVGSDSAIYVFHVSAQDAWTSSSTPTATLHAGLEPFVGLAIAISSDGTTLVAGTPFYNGGAGGAHIFHASSEDAWASTSTPTATLSNAAEDPNDQQVGRGVAMSGDGTTVLVTDAVGGSAYVYHASAEDAWASSSTPTAILSDNAQEASRTLSPSPATGRLHLSAYTTVSIPGWRTSFTFPGQPPGPRRRLRPRP